MEFFTIRFAALFILLKLSNTLLYTFFLILSRVIICSIEIFLHKILIFAIQEKKPKTDIPTALKAACISALFLPPSLLFLPYPEKLSQKRGDYSGGTNENYLHIFFAFRLCILAFRSLKLYASRRAGVHISYHKPAHFFIKYIICNEEDI